MANKEHYWEKYRSCCLWGSSTACGEHDGLDALLSTEELKSWQIYIGGVPISKYMLIKSRCRNFYDGAAICPRHCYSFCEDYVPQRHCVCCHMYNTYNTTELIQMSVKASLFVPYVPIRKSMDTKSIRTA